MLRWRAFQRAKTLECKRGESIDVVAESLWANSAAQKQERLLEPVERRNTSARMTPSVAAAAPRVRSAVW